MKTIRRYPIDNGSIPILQGAEIISIQVEEGLPYIYAMVDTDAHIDWKVFVIIKSEMPILENFDYKFIGTFQARFETYHAFEISKKEKL